METIKITCITQLRLSLDEVHDFQGQLKELSTESFEKLKTSILKYGYTFPCFVWLDVESKKWMTIDAHQRNFVCRKLIQNGYKIEGDKIPCVEIMAANKKEAKEKILLATSQYARINEKGFSEFLKESCIDFSKIKSSIDFSGFNLFKFEKGMENKKEKPASGIEQLPLVSQSKIGTIWTCGNHIVTCNDSTKTAEILNLCKEWDVLIFDPPYEIETLYSEAMLPSAPNKKLIVFWDFKRFGIAPATAIKFGWKPQYELIWDCVTSWFQPNRPLARHKACGVFGDNPYFDIENALIKDGKERKSGKAKNNRGEYNYQSIDGHVHLRTIESFPTGSEDGGHKHSKPVEWIKAIFNGVKGNLFLDLFGGSGTTLVVCELIGKKSFTVELSELQCDAIVNRWTKMTGQSAKNQDDIEFVPY